MNSGRYLGSGRGPYIVVKKNRRQNKKKNKRLLFANPSASVTAGFKCYIFTYNRYKSKKKKK